MNKKAKLKMNIIYSLKQTLMQRHNENGTVMATKRYDRATNINPQTPAPSLPDSRGSLVSK